MEPPSNETIDNTEVSAEWGKKTRPHIPHRIMFLSVLHWEVSSIRDSSFLRQNCESVVLTSTVKPTGLFLKESGISQILFEGISESPQTGDH